MENTKKGWLAPTVTGLLMGIAMSALHGLLGWHRAWVFLLVVAVVIGAYYAMGRGIAPWWQLGLALVAGVVFYLVTS